MPRSCSTATNFDYKKVLNLREACGIAKMPPNPRAMVLDAGYYTNLLADDVVAKSFNLNLNAPAVTEGTSACRINLVAGEYS